MRSCAVGDRWRWVSCSPRCGGDGGARPLRPAHAGRAHRGAADADAGADRDPRDAAATPSATPTPQAGHAAPSSASSRAGRTPAPRARDGGRRATSACRRRSGQHAGAVRPDEPRRRSRSSTARLPCGAKLMSTRRSTEPLRGRHLPADRAHGRRRAAARGTGAGRGGRVPDLADDHITRWMRGRPAEDDRRRRRRRRRRPDARRRATTVTTAIT